jgi:hypothetical protein
VCVIVCEIVDARSPSDALLRYANGSEEP